MTHGTYRTDVVLAVASGVNVSTGPWSEQHDLITDLAGWPVMTHQLARPEVWEGCRTKILAQVSWVEAAIAVMPTFDGAAEQQVRDWLAPILATHGPEVVLDHGDPLPVLPFMAGLEHLGADRQPADAPTTWWHAYGRTTGENDDVWQLTIYSGGTAGPEVAREQASPSVGEYLASWDREPTEVEQDALAPPAFRSRDSEGNPL